jgi:hypothetical protein
VTTDGRPSGTKATRIETAKVTVAVACPLYTVEIPTAKKTIAKVTAMREINMTKLALLGSRDELRAAYL